MTDIDKTLLAEYLLEAGEHLEELEALLLQVADQPESTTLLDDIFRAVHSIKGAAQYLGLARSSQLAHRLEDLLDLLRNGERRSSAAIVELLIAACDRLACLADELETAQAETSAVDDVVARITAVIEDDAVAAEPCETDVEQQSAESDAQPSNATDHYTEENDQELFAIFMENLRERIDLIRTQSGELAQCADKVVLLARCAESIQSLCSAANYMGYEELTQIYSNWLEDIAAVQQALGRHEDVPYDFMDAYLSEITAQFPQIEPPRATDTTSVQAATADDTELERNLLSEYLLEAGEHLEELEALLLQLADQPERTALLNEIFRAVHSIKGAAQYLGLARSSQLAHRLEDLLDLLRNGERRSSAAIVELLIAACDRLACLADELETAQAETSAVDDVVARITAEIEDGAAAAEPGETEVEQQSVELAAQPANGTDHYTEENDQELFAIFLENLRERIDLIRTQSGELAQSADKVVLLARCAESIQGLRSAANYMGYEELTRIYSNWLEDITAVQQALARHEDAPYDFMDAYLSEITAQFPQISPDSAEPADMLQPDAAALPEPDHSRDQADDTDEDRVYRKLSAALDNATSPADEPEFELLHGVFEEMIAENEAAPAAHEEDTDTSEGQPAESSKQPAADHAMPAKPEQTVPPTADAAAAGGQRAKPQSADSAAVDAPGGRGDADKTVARQSKDTSFRKSVRVDAEKIDSLINQVGELVVDRAYFFRLFEDMRGLQQYYKDEIGLDQKELKQIRAFTYRMGEALASLSRTSNELQEGVMKVRMLPISALFNRYPRLVHDLTRQNNKKVNLKVEGEDTELDKMVVEKLSDPLIHIIRNAVDHGIEAASERVSAGKPEAGTLYLKSYHESNQVVVEIIDDGRGIDPNRVKAKAIEKGIVSANEAARMTPQETIRLITAAGFSTAEQITDTSGRGVGMDVVRKNIEKLNGTLEIDSKKGLGTAIRLRIPLTLAIIPAHLVRVSSNLYTIPLANIEETLRIGRDETTIIEGAEVVYLRGKTLPIIHLAKLFNTTRDAADRINFFVVVVNTGTQKIGLVVDELLGQEEVVIKPLVDYLRDGTGFSGATIIGDGSISLILDIYEIAHMTTNLQIRRQHELGRMRSANADGRAAVRSS